jgi:hypothetical protein
LLCLEILLKWVLEAGWEVVDGGMCYFIGREGGNLEQSREARVRIHSYTLSLLSLLVLRELELLSSGYAGLLALSWRCRVLLLGQGEETGGFRAVDSLMQLSLPVECSNALITSTLSFLLILLGRHLIQNAPNSPTPRNLLDASLPNSSTAPQASYPYRR